MSLLPAERELRARTRKQKEARKYRLRRLGASLQVYNALERRQFNKCAICESKPATRRLALDHCHSTGKIRGLLCHRCNVAIGLFWDSRLLLERAINYLAKSEGL